MRRSPRDPIKTMTIGPGQPFRMPGLAVLGGATHGTDRPTGERIRGCGTGPTQGARPRAGLAAGRGRRAAGAARPGRAVRGRLPRCGPADRDGRSGRRHAERGAAARAGERPGGLAARALAPRRRARGRPVGRPTRRSARAAGRLGAGAAGSGGSAGGRAPCDPACERRAFRWDGGDSDRTARHDHGRGRGRATGRAGSRPADRRPDRGHPAAGGRGGIDERKGGHP